MKRPSFQMYQGDWLSNAKLRRCSWALRGVWIDAVCLLADSDEHGVLRWPLKELANALGCPLKMLQELRDKGVLKGADAGERMAALTYTPRHAGKAGKEVVLLPDQAGPVWYSSRMVRDEYVRTLRATQGTVESPPKGGIGEPSGDHPSRDARAQSSSASSSPSGEEKPKPVVGPRPDDDLATIKRREARAIGERSIAYLNAKAGTRFKPTEANLKLPVARVLYDKASEEDLRAVVDLKVAEAGKGEFDRKYLRPATLWNAEKFSQYSGQVSITNAPPAPVVVKVFAERGDGTQELITEYQSNGATAEDAAKRALAQHRRRFDDFKAKNIVLDNGRDPRRFSLEELKAA